MAGAKRFEDLLMWQRARALANVIYKLTEAPSFRDANLRNQMLRAAVSVMSNIAEGFGRGTNEELLKFLFIAKGSLTELQSQLYLSLDLHFVSAEQFKAAQNLCAETARLIQAFASSMNRGLTKGFKHKRKVIPWAERAEKMMKEISGESEKT